MLRDKNLSISAKRSPYSFVDEPLGDGMKKEPSALEDIKTYVRNVAFWLVS
jgi:hypothetical protein